jgi:hypothetical protein
MTGKMDAAWLAALGASVMMMGVHAYGIAQKPVAPKRVTAPKAPAAPKAAATPKTPATTLTGCLQMDGNQFALTHLKGSEVRTGRSWKSGFMKKTAKSVEVVGVSPNVKLKDHVGREVSVVGTRSDERHLRASSVKRVASSCAQ